MKDPQRGFDTPPPTMPCLLQVWPEAAFVTATVIIATAHDAMVTDAFRKALLGTRYAHVVETTPIPSLDDAVRFLADNQLAYFEGSTHHAN